MSKPRSDAKLLNLPIEQQAQLAEWLLSGVPYHRARKLCMGSEAEGGFGVTASIQAFSDFWYAVCAPELLKRRTRAVSTAEFVAEEAARNPGQFDAATIDALKQKAFELAYSPGADPKEVKAIFALVLKARDQDAAAEDRKLEREKFEFDGAKAAKEHAPYIKAVSADKSLTENEKIDKIRKRMWGTKIPSASPAAK